MKIKSKVLLIAGSDSSGGAGIQADIKTVTSLGSYAMTAITAVTSQNTTGVKSIIEIDPNTTQFKLHARIFCVGLGDDPLWPIGIIQMGCSAGSVL